VPLDTRITRSACCRFVVRLKNRTLLDEPVRTFGFAQKLETPNERCPNADEFVLSTNLYPCNFGRCEERFRNAQLTRVDSC
jgi:hypothetical protein